jgi:hypothetical protein
VEMGAVVSARKAIAQAEQQLIHQFSATLKSDSKTP